MVEPIEVPSQAPIELQPLEMLMQKLQASEQQDVTVPEVQAALEQLKQLTGPGMEEHTDRLQRYHQILTSYLADRTEVQGGLRFELDKLHTELPEPPANNRGPQRSSVDTETQKSNEEIEPQRSLTYDEFLRVADAGKQLEKKWFGKTRLHIMYWMYLLADHVRKQPRTSFLRKIADKLGMMASITAVTTAADLTVVAQQRQESSEAERPAVEQPPATSTPDESETEPASPERKTYAIDDPVLEQEKIDLLQSNAALKFEKEGQQYEMYLEKQDKEMLAVINGKKYRIFTQSKDKRGRNVRKNISVELGRYSPVMKLQSGRTSKDKPAFVFSVPHLVTAHIPAEELVRLATFVHRNNEAENAAIRPAATQYLYSGFRGKLFNLRRVKEEPTSVQFEFEEVR
jgi:hypothetical protein